MLRVIAFLDGYKEAAEESHPVRHFAGEIIGQATAPVASIAAGAGSGALLGKLFGGNTAAGAMKGGIAGAAVVPAGIVLGSLLALINKRRSVAEQKKHDTTGSSLADMTIPGLSTYNTFKRTGSTLNQ